ncbi:MULTISPECIES: type I restriction endonuclease [unclassified Xanthobacter]|uniref:type I restriction endonuclease n=1 Tax=unclassified Xanthobacter TaxID=2623496 RepID=UPI001EDFEA1D|nr:MULTISPECIES: type I restriction endonuclease [unclassified Xanthobacter]
MDAAALSDFREKLTEFAKRAVTAAPRCLNEESTKMFLVVPMISFLGYDPMDPNEVFPEHHCDFSEKYKNRVDFAIFKGGEPVIALETKPAGAPSLRDDRGQLRSYFNAARTVKMGVLTDGLVWEFYADSDEPNMMDANPFLRFDLRDVARGKVDESALEGLSSLGKAVFDPDNIGAEAKRKHIYNSVLGQVATIFADPPEEFARPLLKKAGIGHISQKALDEYRPIIQAALREFISRQILHRLDLPKPDAPAPAASTDAAPPAPIADNVITTERELAVYRWVLQRLAFLVSDDALFGEIAAVEYRDYQGQFVVFYKMERKGRLFEFIESKTNPGYRFVFPEEAGLPAGDVTVPNLQDIDAPLLAVFTARVAGIGKSADKTADKSTDKAEKAPAPAGA